VQFNKFEYIGDPCNTVRIFNELIPNLKILRDIADECFMPLSYGGGISTFEQAKQILNIGFEKIVINTQAYYNPELVRTISAHFGTQAVVVSIDVRKTSGRHYVFINDGKVKIPDDAVEYARRMEIAGAGEILLTSIDREGTWEGFDVEIVRKISSNVSIPVIANGGAGSVKNIGEVVKIGGASAVALGSMLVYQKKGMGVLVNFPDKNKLETELQ
jgi:cyclase